MTVEQRDRYIAWFVILGFFLVAGLALSQTKLKPDLNATFTKINPPFATPAARVGNDDSAMPAVTESLLDRVRRENDFRPAPKAATAGANLSGRPATMSNGPAGSFPVATFPEPTFSNPSPPQLVQPAIAMPAPVPVPGNGGGAGATPPRMAAEAMRERAAQMTRCSDLIRATTGVTSPDAVVRRHQEISACLSGLR